MTTQEKLKSLGLTTAAEVLDTRLTLKKKLMIAYEKFRYVTPEKMSEFNAQLRQRTFKEEGGWGTSYQALSFISLSQYTEVPPPQVLEKLSEAKEFGIFDSFEVAKIESVKQVKDPILFGVINGCGDRFYIAQWDDDVKIEDILKENEG